MQKLLGGGRIITKIRNNEPLDKLQNTHDRELPAFLRRSEPYFNYQRP